MQNNVNNITLIITLIDNSILEFTGIKAVCLCINTYIMYLYSANFVRFCVIVILWICS